MEALRVLRQAGDFKENNNITHGTQTKESNPMRE